MPGENLVWEGWGGPYNEESGLGLGKLILRRYDGSTAKQALQWMPHGYRGRGPPKNCTWNRDSSVARVERTRVQGLQTQGSYGPHSNGLECTARLAHPIATLERDLEKMWTARYKYRKISMISRTILTWIWWPEVGMRLIYKANSTTNISSP